MELIVIGIVIAVAASLLTAFSFAPWVPTRRRDVERVLRLAALRPGERFVELGCGDARVLLAAAAVPGVQATGVELSLPIAGVAWARVALAHSPARVRWGSLYHFDLVGTDVVYCFGVPHRLRTRFSEKLRRELSPGARVISYAFPVEGLEPVLVDRPTGGIPIYCYAIDGKS